MQNVQNASQNAKEIDYWMLFFPSEDIDLILQCTNANLRDKRKIITKGEFYKTIGIMYAMTVNVLHSRRDYWSTQDNLFPAPAFGKRFGQGYHRFEEILNSMAFSIPAHENNDKWKLVRPFIEMTVSKCRDVFSPGYKITVDESMFAWYGKGLHGTKEGGMPAVIKIKRKPKGVGCECKTLADVQTGIMIGIEINEGKEVMKDKLWQKEFGAGTATTLRLTQPWFGTGRIVVGDSWFASVKTAIELRKQGLYFLGIVKTATKMYPMTEAKARCPKKSGKKAVATATVNGTDLTCVAWKDKKVFTFIGSCGTTLNGEPAKKNRIDADGNVAIKIVPRPKIVEEYFDGAPAIDIHNHIRQSGLALENSWSTQQWHHRMFASLFGIIEANAYLAFKFFKKEKSLKHSTFVEALSQQLFNNQWVVEEQAKVVVNEADTSLRDNHTLVQLSIGDDRQRVQRRCRICSRVFNRVQKSSYRCSGCGDNAIICSPTTGRTCFSYHIIHGIPN
ncbi:uncharacterized protein LOC127285709 [Leptopilina boulardi]|uniref:uncharacterized protein LOC127285709 n=1 Tax=Leptopilina boulardi TaxID=63433 RepID=UPI0021F5FFAD|nr:uncharacterized protein LOC127285709 [Leptopilina boulardi]